MKGVHSHSSQVSLIKPQATHEICSTLCVKKLNVYILTSLITAALLPLTGCTPPQSSVTSPEPEVLVSDPRYTEQVQVIDKEREERGEETLTELVAQNRVTKIPNGTEPIVVEISSERTMDEAKAAADIGIKDSIHEGIKVRIEEYFIIDENKEPEDSNNSSDQNQETPSSTEAIIPSSSEEVSDVAVDSAGNKNIDNELSEVQRKAEENRQRLLEIKRRRDEIQRRRQEPNTVFHPGISNEIAQEIKQPTAPEATSNYNPPATKTDTNPRTAAKLQSVENQNSATNNTTIPTSREQTIRPRARPIKASNEEEAISDIMIPPAEGPPNSGDTGSPYAVTSSLRPTARPSDLDTSQSISNFKARWDSHARGSDYTRYTLDAIERYANDLLEATHIDDAGYCSSLNSLSRDQKKQFWLMFISGVARWESGFDTSEKFLERKSRRYSRGLLQLDYQHRAAYRCNDLYSPQDLHDARKNLTCGVKMVRHLVLRDGIIRGGRTGAWKGAADFWSVLRPEIWSGEKRRNVLTIPAETNKLDFCR